MRARLLKPSFFKNETLAKLPYRYRLGFAGLWTLADREGRLEYRPERIKAEIFPFDDEVNGDDIRAMIQALKTAGFITVYGNHQLQIRSNQVGSDQISYRSGHKSLSTRARYIAINTFSLHQSPHHREPASRLPAPPLGRFTPRAQVQAQPPARPGHSPGRGPTVLDPVTGDPVTGIKSSGADAPPGKSSGADAPRQAHRTADDPTNNVSVITKLAHEAITVVGPTSPDLSETVKGLCALHDIAYNSGVVTQAIQSALVQRQQPRKAQG